MRGKHGKVSITEKLIPFIVAGLICGTGWFINQTIKDNNQDKRINEIKIEEVEEVKPAYPVIPEEESEKKDETLYGMNIIEQEIVKPTTTVNIRDNASLDSNILTTINPSTTLEYIDQENDWYKVKYNDTEVYVSSNYSNKTTNVVVKDKLEKVIYFKNDSTLLDGNNEVLDNVPKLEVGLVYKDNGDNYSGIVNGKAGYIKKEDTEELKDTFVIVDISDQTAYLYENNELVASTPVVTGKNSTPTTKGVHEVWLMEKDRYLKGADFKVHVDVVAFFHNGEGIHDANWRSAFGGELYKQGGSHGCVNMPNEAAKTFYKNLNVGDTVLVKE